MSKGLEAGEVLDRLAIREVLAKYMLAMRTHDLDLMDDVFTADAVIDYTAIGGSRAPWSETKPWLHAMTDVDGLMSHDAREGRSDLGVA